MNPRRLHGRIAAIASSGAGPSGENGSYGNLESVTGARMTGWALIIDRGQPRQPLEVRLLDESGSTIGQGVVSEFRQDVLDAGYASGWVGFSININGGRPAPALIELQAAVDNTWVSVSRVELDSIAGTWPSTPSGGAPYFEELLTVFARAGTVGSLVGRQGLRLGEDLWVQVSSDGTDSTQAALRTEADASGDDLAFLRVHAADGQISRVDLRFRLTQVVSEANLCEVRVPIRARGGRRTPTHLSLFQAGSRTRLETHLVSSGAWRTIAASLPQVAWVDPAGTDEEAAVWLEVSVRDVRTVDVGQVEVLQLAQAQFECPAVAQRSDLVVRSGQTKDHEGVDGEEYTVVIPFYNNKALTGHCVDSILSHSSAAPHILLVDDGSGSQQDLRLLGGLRSNVSVIQLSPNRGYTAAVNAGVRAARTEKVVILNNDTKVLPGWDEPLLRALNSPDVFASGPLSNAASYQSVPRQRDEHGWVVNQYPVGVHPSALARRLREHFGESVVDWEVLNGFCYAVRGSMFLELGALDEQAFPRGYGEEVDLMMRAKAAGLHTKIAPSSFVYHYKSKTFGKQRSGLTQEGSNVVWSRWGDSLREAIDLMDASEGLREVQVAVSRILEELVDGYQ